MAELLYNYSFFNMISSFSKIKGKGDINVIGFNPTVFYTVFVITSLLWVIALAFLVMNVNRMPAWLIVLCILLLLFASGGPVIVIIICLLLKGRKIDQYHGLPYSPDMYSPSESIGQRRVIYM